MASPQRKEPTNAEIAERFGVSTRTVSKIRGRSRDWWTQHRREIRQKAARLRATGMTWAEVGKALGVSESAARALGKRATGAWADGSPQPARDTATPDLFAPEASAPLRSETTPP